MMDDLLASARTEISSNPEGILSLGLRKQLWKTFCDLTDGRSAHLRRVTLDKMCIKHVQSIWQMRFPTDNGIDTMLKLADQVMRNEISKSDARDIRDDFYVDVVENRKYGSDFSPMLVGHAAANTVIEAMIFNTDDALPLVDRDEDLDPESYHPSYLCASAAAHGLNGRTADIDARRGFWMWYCDIAIPKVCTLTI